MGKYFGTDGFRGEANEDLTAQHAFQVGRYLGWYFGRSHQAKIVIGKDTRKSSDMLESALASGLTASGADAYLLHVTTTPSVSYVVSTEEFDCGVMISASHNPYCDNGIKIIGSNGQKIKEEVELAIEDYIDGTSGELPLAKRGQIGRIVDDMAARERYITHLLSVPVHSYRNIRVGLDCSNGSASAIAGRVFDTQKATVSLTHHEPDGTNINRNCGSTHIETLQQLVVEQQLDVGFAYDGDADRCIAVNGDGETVDGDAILYICGNYLHAQGKLKKDTVVTTVMSNLGLYKSLTAEGLSYEQTPVGDKYVCECMFQNGYCLGGEQSGHIIFSDYAATGDGILTSLMLMEAMTGQNADLGTLTRNLKIYPQILQNVRVKDKNAAMENPRIKEIIAQTTRELGEEGRVLVRQSGTEPLIRVMVEASTNAICRQQADRIVKVLHDEGLTA